MSTAGRSKLAARLGLFGAVVIFLAAFPLYHHLAAPTDVLRWAPPSVWGPGAGRHPDGGFSFSPAPEAAEDQGVTWRLQHGGTRRIRLAPGARIGLKARCEPAPCGVELHAIAPGLPVAEEGAVVSVGSSPGTVSAPIPAAVADAGVTEIRLIRPRRLRTGPGPVRLTVLGLDLLDR